MNTTTPAANSDNTPTREARVLALLLGEADPTEAAATNALLDADPALRLWRDQAAAILPVLLKALRPATANATNTTNAGTGDAANLANPVAIGIPPLRMDETRRAALLEKLGTAAIAETPPSTKPTAPTTSTASTQSTVSTQSTTSTSPDTPPPQNIISWPLPAALRRHWFPVAACACATFTLALFATLYVEFLLPKFSTSFAMASEVEHPANADDDGADSLSIALEGNFQSPALHGERRIQKDISPAAAAAAVEAAATAPAERLVPLRLQIPAPDFVGTPQPIKIENLDTRTGNGPNVTIYTAQPAPIFALGSPSSMDASTRSLPEVSAELKQVTDAIIGTGGRMSRATGNVSQGVGGDNGGGAATSRRRGVILMSPPMVSRDAVFHGSIMGGTGTGAITTATEALPADPTVVTEGDEPAAIAAEAPPLAAEVAEVSLAARATPRAPTPAAQNPFSTFSLNVSDASFRLAAEALRKNRWPERATLRTEEFVNALTYNDPPPAAGHALALAQEQARDPFGHSRNLLRLSLQTASTGRNPRQPLNLTVLLDTSGSMERADRQAVVAEALRALAGNIHDDDTVGLLGFARTPDLRFQERGAKARAKLLAQIGNITPEGGTNLERALRDAFTQNSTASVAGAQNRVVLLTDGAANLGDANPARLAELIAKNKKNGITLDCFGIGFDGYNDAMLETLARAANGRYAYLNNAAEAREDFARKLAGALQVAAQNVKVQVEFNPARVVSWRLLGYEKHLLTKEQFRDNTVLAAQLGAAESGTAVYAVEINAKGFGGVGVVRARFQDPRTGEYHERDWAIPYDPATPPLDKAPPGIQLAAVAALSAEKFDGSEEARLVPWKSLADILRTANNALGLFPANLRLLQMLDQAHRLE